MLYAQKNKRPNSLLCPSVCPPFPRICNVSQGGITSYTFNNVTANRTISATFNYTGGSGSSPGSGRRSSDNDSSSGSGKKVQSFGAGSVSVTIPYTLGANEKAENVCAVYIDSNGNVHWLTSSVYYRVEKVLRFATSHFSTYGIGYKQTDITFTDITNHWAKENGIVIGTTDGKFLPDASITREQMAVIMQNYAKVIGFTLAKVHGENIFANSDKISAYAKYSVKQMQMAGVINGKNGNFFDPQGTPARAKVSAVLRRFVELTISSDTM